MRKKLLISILVLVIGVLGVLAYNNFLKEETVSGLKEIQLEVIIDKKDINCRFDFATDKGYLVELMKENKDKLKFSYNDFEYGTMINALMGYEADENENEFFHISVNGQQAQTGIDEIVLSNDDIYRFELKTW